MLLSFLAVLSILSRTCIPWLLKLMVSLSSQVHEFPLKIRFPIIWSNEIEFVN